MHFKVLENMEIIQKGKVPCTLCRKKKRRQTQVQLLCFMYLEISLRYCEGKCNITTKLVYYKRLRLYYMDHLKAINYYGVAEYLRK